jgi:hypothetical protein
MPIAIEDPRLGRFEWDQDRWVGSFSLLSRRVVQFNIVPATNNHIPGTPGVFTAAYPVAAWLRETEAAIYLAVSRKMVDLYNGTWSEEPPITAEEFACRINLVEVSVPSTGEYINLWFTDGEMEMFGGHDIDVYFGGDCKLRSANLAG